MAEFCRLDKLLPWKKSSIRVKVYRRRETEDSEGNPAMDFILADKYGKKIHATVSHQYFHRFKRDLPEDQWREITNVHVSDQNWNHPTHMLARHQYMITLDGPTGVRPIPSLRDSHMFDFTDFNQVITRVVDAAYPIDLTGVVGYIGKLQPTELDNEEKTCIPFHLKDHRNQEIYCVAYGQLAPDFNIQRRSFTQADTVICVLSEWRVTFHNGEVLVTGEGGLARIFINPWIEERDVMRHRFLHPDVEEPQDNNSVAGSSSAVIC
ncbi:unnamed protein product [Microthlaspi erraticum]|uniref:Replication protein A 70 kDa DNA-binding subunit B/D first OB fold domain-containing protein n=1 Tax=Microthlaspi erraticum TaxID=1685480 RepID=A0A6D2J5U4_9BRAS|nr:unnamed protein product [Microthlaspi erraticum]